MKKKYFDNEPAMVVQEGSVVRINFDVEHTTEERQNPDGETEQVEVIKAYVIRVQQPMTIENIKVAMAEGGFDEYKAEEVATGAMLFMAQSGYHVGDELELAKRMVTAKIGIYDNSKAVNEFFLNDVSMWLDDATRTKLKKRFETDEEDGLTTTKLIYEGVPFDLPIELAKSMLHQLESYARDCFDKTNEHKAAVASKKKEETVLAYDYTVGYPEKLHFNSEP